MFLSAGVHCIFFGFLFWFYGMMGKYDGGYTEQFQTKFKQSAFCFFSAICVVVFFLGTS